jgi:two-component system, cell cycle response regulator DivK
MKKILVAEDSSVIQNLTRKILEFQNFQIVSVKNGKEVMDKLNADDYALVLLDINMPVMDGMECARLIRKMDEPKRNIPIIAITGNAKNYSMEEFAKVGINEYMQKPLNYDLLVERVKALAE